nr:MAG TPA: hypothetical protein [Caudoviricetes sp.]
MKKETIIKLLEENNIDTNSITFEQDGWFINMILDDTLLPIIKINEILCDYNESEFELVNLYYNPELEDTDYKDKLTYARTLLEDLKEEQEIVLADNGYYYINLKLENEKPVLDMQLRHEWYSRYLELKDENQLAEYLQIASRIEKTGRF